MLLAVAVLLIHPQLASAIASSADNSAPDMSIIIGSAMTGASTIAVDTDNSSPSLTTSLGATDTAVQPAIESRAVLPDAPTPVLASVASAAPIAFIKPGKPLTVSVEQLQAETRRKEFMWRGLAIAASGAATFDALTTRHAITTYGAVELNPMLRPFAGNSSLFAAIQVAPALLDFAGRKMMYNRHSWIRRAWWVPQSASFVSSVFCGAHNLAYR